MRILVSSFFLLISLYFLNRLRKYPTERGLRLPTLFSISPFFLKIPLIRAANSFLRFSTRKERSIMIERSDGSALAVALYKRDGMKPLLIYIHGGGFFFSAPKAAYKEAERYSNELDFKVAMPDYMTSDEKPYPYPFLDIREALLFFVKNRREYNLSDEIYIAGDSAGGALAIELTKFAIENKIKIRKLLLIYPVIDDSMTTPSMQKYNDSPLWNSRLNRRMWEVYLREGRGKYAVPSEIQDLSGFPPTFIEVEEYDALRDEGLLFAEKLRKAGVPVTLKYNEKCYHGFDYFKSPLSVEKAKKERIAFLSD